MVFGLNAAAIVWTANGFGIPITAVYYLALGISILLVHLAVTFLSCTILKIGFKFLRE